MIGVRLSVPFATWTRPRANFLQETFLYPSIATCYGCMLSAVGETDRTKHAGVRVTVGVVSFGEVSTILTSPWKIQTKERGRTPTLTQVVVGSELIVYVDSSDDANDLESRIVRAIEDPKSVNRFGPWCLGYSSNLIDFHRLYKEGFPQADVFLLDDEGEESLPVWIDYIKRKITWVSGSLATTENPTANNMPVVRK